MCKHYDVKCIHVHTVSCIHSNNPSKCVDTIHNGKIVQRHCPKDKYGKNIHVDEQIHDAYWRTMGFKDPCTSAKDQMEFKKCKAYCGHSKHEKKKDDGTIEEDRVYCELDLWHPKVVGDKKGKTII